jgi:hypothetical protein
LKPKNTQVFERFRLEDVEKGYKMKANDTKVNTPENQKLAINESMNFHGHLDSHEP